MAAKFFDTVPVDEVLHCTDAALSGAPSSGVPNEPSPATPRRRTILVVDDEHVIADTLAAILNASGFSAVAAYNGESALQLISARGPDLVITDVSMPGMNGIDLAIAVRERFASCKVLLFSGHAASTNLMAEARAKGYDFELLTKPVHPRDLLERLNRDLLERQNEAPQQKSALSGFEFDELVKHQRLILKART